MTTILLATAAGGAAGALAGVPTRWLLTRLRRGAAVGPAWCELALGLLWGAGGAALGAGVLPVRAVPLLGVLSWLAVAGSVTDLLRRRLPDVLTLPALPMVLVALAPAGGAAVLRGAGGALLLAGVYATVHVVMPRGLGAGDVKLALPVGAALAGAGWPVLVLGTVVAAVLGAGLAGVAVATGRAGRGTGLPHGPVLLAAALLVVSVTVAGPGPPAPGPPALAVVG